MAWHERIRNVLRPERLSADLDDELAFHLAELTDELTAEGMTRDEAAREARRRFGSYLARKEETRSMDIARTLEALLGDLRYGARQLRLNPGFTAVAVLSLGLGIGANSAIFQLINALRLRSLPVQEAERLVAIGKGPDFLTSGWFTGRHNNFTYAQFEQMTMHQEAFEGLTAFATGRFNLSRGGEARYAEGIYVTPNFLEVLGVAPMIGGWLPADTDPRDCAGVGALLGHTFWQREYGGEPSAVGRDISLNGRSFPILGVTPPSFQGVEPARRFDVAVPVCADRLFDSNGQGRLTNMTAWWLTPIGRLKPGWSVERASAHMHDISPIVFRATQPASYRPDALKKYVNNKLTAVSAQAGVSSVRREYEDPLWILLASTGLVLMIACANLANLLLARATARQREVALRQAVGASRSRLIAQLMSESSLLAVLGAALGGGVAFALSRGLIAFLSQSEEQLAIALEMDWRVFGFTVLLALTTCLLFGLTPALRATHGAPADAMRGGRGAAEASESHGLRRALVIGQIALSFVLLVGALLFGQSLRNLLAAETGIVSDGVLMARIDAKLPDLEAERRSYVFQQLEESINSLPEVESASMVSIAPFSGGWWNESVHADDDPATTGGQSSWFTRISPGYFKTMRTPLLAGRMFGPQDDLSAPQVAIVNEKFAAEFFDGADPVGRTFRKEARAGEADPTYRIVGLVTNTKYYDLREEARPIAFLPILQDEEVSNELSYAVRARGPFSGVMAGIRQRMAEIDPALLVEFRVLEFQVSRSVVRERLMANLSGGFGVLAGLLSALGLYGVMSYMVMRRRNEIGVRMALGAERQDIRRLVFGEAGRLLLAGLAIGLTGTLALSRFAESLLFGLEPNDAVTLGMGCGLLAVTAFGAALIPVRRAMRLDPATVLRSE